MVDLVMHGVQSVHLYIFVFLMLCFHSSHVVLILIYCAEFIILHIIRTNPHIKHLFLLSFRRLVLLVAQIVTILQFVFLLLPEFVVILGLCLYIIHCF